MDIQLKARTPENVLTYFERTKDPDIERMFPRSEKMNVSDLDLTRNLACSVTPLGPLIPWNMNAVIALDLLGLYCRGTGSLRLCPRRNTRVLRCHGG